MFLLKKIIFSTFFLSILFCQSWTDAFPFQQKPLTRTKRTFATVLGQPLRIYSSTYGGYPGYGNYGGIGYGYPSMYSIGGYSAIGAGSLNHRSGWRASPGWRGGYV